MSIWKTAIAGLALVLSLAACGNQPPAPRTSNQSVMLTPTPPPAPVAQPTPPPEQQSAAKPAPAPVAKKFTGQMVAVGGGTFCPDYIAAEGIKRWATLGAMPNTDVPLTALPRLKGLPPAVVADVMRQYKNNMGSSGKIKRGDVLCSMTYSDGGKHLVWNNVEMQLKDKAEISVLVFRMEKDGYIYEVLLPPKSDGLCDNWTYRVRRKLVAQLFDYFEAIFT